ncbi:MAG: ABC transporter substrate-binding protein [Candidatus Binatia bacterium]
MRTAAFGLIVNALVLALFGAATAAPQSPPQRIISLAPSVTETLFALDIGERVVGVSTYCDYPPAALRIERVGTFLQPNVERILALRPDLVIAVPSPGNRAPVERLERLGVSVLVVDPQRITDVFHATRAIAAATGVPEAGERLVASIERALATVEVRLEGARRVSVLMLVGRSPLVAAGSGTFQDELITRARGENIAAAAGKAWPNLTLEFVIARAPEIIIDAGMGSEQADAAGAKEFWQRFPNLPAVRHGRIYGYGAYELLRPGPRVAHTLEIVARFIHPERF